MGSPPSDDESPKRPTGPPPSADAESSDRPPTRSAIREVPPRRQTMEVQMAWLDLRADEPKVEQVAVPANEETTEAGDPAVEEAADADERPPNEFPSEAPTALRVRPPRVPGALRTLPPMPMSGVATKPPPPLPRRHTVEVEMSWVELVDEDVAEDPPAEPAIPKLFDENEPREITRVEDAPVSSERIEKEKAVVAAAREEAAVKKERLSQFLQAVSAATATATTTATATATATATSDADLDKMREEALAARKREQDARDRELRERRRAERERERIEQEAKQARREQEKREEEERAAAIRQGTPDRKLLDLSGIDDEIDSALDAMLGPNLSDPGDGKK